MGMLELVGPQPDWMGALGVALTRPPGIPERRTGEDAWKPRPIARPRRISDDLAWLREAIDEPVPSGLSPLEGSAAVAAWNFDAPEVLARLTRLRDRGVLDSAGFLLHEPEPAGSPA